MAIDATSQDRATPARPGLDADGDPRLFVLSGMSRLAVRVANALAERGQVVVLFGEDPERLEELLDPRVQRRRTERRIDRELRQVDLSSVECFLALDDDDLDNVAASVAAKTIAPAVPVVVRAFNASIADQLEGLLGVRRAFSTAAISAPSFVACVLGARVVETMRLGDTQVPICAIDVPDGSPLVGLSPLELQRRFGCALLGHGGAGEDWQPTTGDEHRLRPGDVALVGGPAQRVLELTRRAGPPTSPPRRGRSPRRSRPRRATRGGLRWVREPTMLPIATIGFAVLLVVTMLVFGLTLHLNPVDALYSAVTTAFGSPNLPASHVWLKVFAVGAMVAGGALVGVLFAYFAAVATAQRLEQRMDRRARRLSGHVVIAGLGKVGYQIEQVLYQMGMGTAVIELAPDPQFLATVGDRTPVLTGDVRLGENLQRAGIEGAAAFIACTTDDLVNIEACVQASRLNPGIRTVARVFDEVLASRALESFRIGATLSTSAIAATAFVGAAVDWRSRRPFQVGGTRYLSLRHEVAEPIPDSQVDEWHRRGVRILAFRRSSGRAAEPADGATALGPGDRMVLAGPWEAVASVLEETGRPEAAGGTSPVASTEAR